MLSFVIEHVTKLTCLKAGAGVQVCSLTVGEFLSHLDCDAFIAGGGMACNSRNRRGSGGGTDGGQFEVMG